MSQRHAVTKKLAAAYKQGSRVDKTRMLEVKSQPVVYEQVS